MAHDTTPVAISDDCFDGEVLHSEMPIVVTFWAPWCAACRTLAPLLAELAGAYSGKLRVLTVNTDDNPLSQARWNILAVPTVLFFHRGQEVDRIVGTHTRALYEKRMAQHAARAKLCPA